MIGWLVRAHVQHLVDEVVWLRAELRSERDRNARLQDQFLSLRVQAPILSTLPPVPREDEAAKDIARVVKSDEWAALGVMEPA